MASLVDFYKQKLDQTGDKLSEFFRPQTGTLATAGRKFIQDIGKKEISLPTPIAETVNRIGSQGGFNRISQEFKSNPLQFTPLSMKSAAVPTGKLLGSEDAGYALRGALSLTPFQSFDTKLSEIEKLSAPTTARQQLAQTLGKTAYGTALTAPLSAGKTVLGTVGNISRNLGSGAVVGTAMQAGSDLLTGNFSKDSLVKGALSGMENAWVLPGTNKITDIALSKIGANKLVGNIASDPFKRGQIKEGFKRLFLQSLAQVPAENTAFTFLNQLDDDTKGKFIENWMNNLPGAIAGNIISGGVAGSVNVFSNPASRKVVNDAIKKTVDEWSVPVTINGRNTVPMWKYKMMYEAKPGFARLDLGLGDTPKLSVEPSSVEGGGKKVYHATNKQFDNFDISKAKTDMGGAKAIFFSETPEGTKYYQRGENSRVIETNISPDAKIFDYQNPEHMALLENFIQESSKNNPEWGDSLRRLIKSGDWGTIERKDVQAVIKKLGFDGFYDMDMTGHRAIGITNPKVLSPSKPETDLLTEARKYKSAEEFVKAQRNKIVTLQEKAKLKITPGDIKNINESGQKYKTTLSEVIDLPSLYKKYPEMKDVPVTFDWQPGSAAGTDWKQIVISPTEVNFKENLLHEIQHIIQKKEGLPTGGNHSIGENFNKYLDIPGEVQARSTAGGNFFVRNSIDESQLTSLYNQATKGVTKVTPIKKPLKEVYGEKLTKGEQILQSSMPQETVQQISTLQQPSLVKPTQQPELPTVQTVNKSAKLDQPSEDIISDARKQIGATPEEKGKSVKQSLDDLYTQWVDRYNPIVKAAKQAKENLRTQGAELRPENDPTYLVRRLTGAGGIADARFRTELNPILKEMESLNIPKSDMDVYLANKRIAGFGQAGRDIYGADPVKAEKVVSALEAKYQGIGDVASKFYSYQDKGLGELAQSGFFSAEDIAKMKSQNPDYAPLYRVMDEMDNYLGLPTRKTMQGTSPINKIKGSTRQIESPVESIIGNTFRQRAAIEKNRVAQSIVDLQKISPDLGFTKVSKSAPDTITVWNNGQKQYWKVGQDIAETAKGVNEESMNLVLKVLQAPAALLRQGATGRNPEFMLPNIIRDQLDAAVSSKYGYLPFIDYVSGLKSMLTNDEVYQKWENSGAKIDLGELSGKKEIKALFDEKVAKKKLSSWIGDALDFMGKYSEQPTRVGLFKKAYQKTGNELIAAMESRDSTVDFARMGSKMKVANSIIPFLNVGVQGFDKLVRNAKDAPGKLAFTLATYAVAPQIMSTLYNLIQYPQEYKEIPQYEKESNFVFIRGRNEDGTVNYVTIPKGNIMPVATNPTQSFLEYAFSNDPQSFKEMALSTLTNTLPVVGKGSSLKEIGIKTIGQNLPQAFKPITENLLNKSFYKYDPKKEQTKEIVPSYMQNKPAYQQTYEFTPKLYQKIGAVLNASPLKVQNFMEGYLAGYSKIPAQIIDTLDNLSQGKEISANDKTILRRFVKTTYPSSSKPAQEKPPVPSLMKRITGKVGASEGTNKTYWYTDDSGNSKSVKIAKYSSMPSATNYDRALKETEKWKLVDDVLNLDPQDQASALKDLGVTKEDAEYYKVATADSSAKYAYVKDQAQGASSYQEFLTKTLPLFREVNGKKVFTDTVINQLYDEGVITSAQKKQLKSIDYSGAKPKLKSGTTKVKYVKAVLPKGTLSTKLPKVKRIRTKRYKLVVPKK